MGPIKGTKLPFPIDERIPAACLSLQAMYGEKRCNVVLVCEADAVFPAQVTILSRLCMAQTDKLLHEARMPGLSHRQGIHVTEIASGATQIRARPPMSGSGAMPVQWCWNSSKISVSQVTSSACCLGMENQHQLLRQWLCIFMDMLRLALW